VFVKGLADHKPYYDCKVVDEICSCFVGMMKSIRFKILLLCLFCIGSDICVAANQTLVMGVFPRRNSVATVKMFTPLTRYLSEEIGVQVKLETAKNFPTFWKKVTDLRYDIVHYNQLHYLLSHDESGYEVFAKNEEFGSSTLRSSLVIRKDSGIESIEDLRGKKIIFGGGKRAMIAYVGVKLMLMKHGLFESDYTTILARNPPNSSLAVFFKKAEAGGVGDIALTVPAVRKRVNSNELTYLKSAYSQPHMPWAFNSKIDLETRKKIRLAFVKLNNTTTGKDTLRMAGMTGVLPAKDGDFESSRKIYRAYKELLKKSNE